MEIPGTSVAANVVVATDTRTPPALFLWDFLHTFRMVLSPQFLH